MLRELCMQRNGRQNVNGRKRFVGFVGTKAQGNDEVGTLAEGFAGFFEEDRRRTAGRDRKEAGGAEKLAGLPRPVEEQEGLKAVRPGFAVRAITDEGHGTGNEGEYFGGI